MQFTVHLALDRGKCGDLINGTRDAAEACRDFKGVAEFFQRRRLSVYYFIPTLKGDFKKVLSCSK